MSQEQEKALHSDITPDEGKPALTAMRGGFGGWSPWSEEEHTKTDIRECTDQHCMNVEVNCGFQGLDPDSPLSQSAGVSDDLRAAWRSKLEGEGKATTGSKSLRDIVFGPTE
ncbi:MAG TPA: hypothetical protein VHH52_11605 [Pseudonocardiaceae bacterium]|nr:hypothetical protein [Pseudonocardiaceae bacterium]